MLSIASLGYFPRILLPLLAFASTAIAFPPLTRNDLYGDPLPPGAIARLGTERLRAGSMSIAFSPDGKRLIGADGRYIREWDARDGRLLSSRVLPGREHVGAFRSEDGRTLLLPTRSVFELWELPAGRHLDLPLPKDRKRTDHAAISIDRRWLLCDDVNQSHETFAGGLVVWQTARNLIMSDTSTGKSRILSEGESNLASLAISPDGKKAVATCGTITKVWDTASGKLLWQVPNYNAETTHFTPDNKYLIAAPGGGQNQWHIWEADTGKPAKDLHPPTGYVWMFAVSPDGTQLLLPTETDYVLWDMKAGKVMHRWPGSNQSGRCTFAPDGKSVVTYDTILRRWDIATGKNLYDNVDSLGHVAPVKKLFFAPDAKRLVSLGEDRTARVWDVRTSKLLRTIRLEPGNIESWAITPDANTLVGIDDHLTVHRWTLSADAPKTTVDLREAQRLNIHLLPREIRIAPDGTLTLLAWPRSPEYSLNRFSFSFWDLATGRLLRWGGDPGQDYRGNSTRLSADGALAASAEALHDTRTGSLRNLPSSPIGLSGGQLFSADGRLLAAIGLAVRITDVATGRMLVDLPPRAYGGDHGAFSPDCRRLACFSNYKLVVWDVWSRKEIVERPVPRSFVEIVPWLSGGMAFSPDGRTLATGHADGTILLWDVPAPSSEGRWNDAEGAAFINDLGDETPANGYPALWQLITQPADATRLLKAKYPLVPAALPDEWQKLIAGLDSARFLEREAASKRLEQLGRAAIMPLRVALKEKPSAEQLRRIEKLLAEMDPSTIRPHGDDLRAMRAVAVLELCGTEEARQLLAQWAERGPSARLADEAERAVDRMKSQR